MPQTVYITTHEQDFRAVQTAAVPGFLKVTVCVFRGGVRDGFFFYKLYFLFWLFKPFGVKTENVTFNRLRRGWPMPTIYAAPNNMCIYLCVWRKSPSKGLGRPNVKVSRSFRHTYTHVFGRTPLHWWSARRRGSYLHNTRISVFSVGFEPAIPACEQPTP